MMSAPAPYPTVQSSAPAPDDAEISTRTPSICVDYLSHKWTDEDVWSSWKAMTKRKNEIANGVRLENASWRTWAKQRGNLKTISPETLNWLKDSDVTWLYGPLHEHAEPVPPPRVATTREVFDLADAPMARTKSILKHRTISEMLTTPGRNASPSVENPHAPSSSGENSGASSDAEGDQPRGGRPSMFPVKSETAISSKIKRQSGSPPASERLFRNLASGDREDGLPHAEEKRHISFNQRVDQCIAVDSHAQGGQQEEEEEEEEEEEDYSDGMYESGSSRRDDEEGSSSDDEVLTMKSSPRSAPAWPLTSSSRGSSPGTYDTHTIAKLAPTILKTSETYPAPSPQVVDPSGFTSHLGAGPEGVNDDEPRVSSHPHVFQYGQDGTDSIAQTQYSRWDADDNFSGDFDYFNGPDVSDGFHASLQDSKGRNSDANEKGMNSQGESVVPDGPADSAGESTGPIIAAAPKGILKRPSAAAVSLDETYSPKPPTTAFSPPSSPEVATTSPPSSPNKERGRPQQRLGSSGSCERLQDAARSSSSSSSSLVGRSRTNSNGTSSDMSEGAASPPSRPTERRESFRGRSGEGSRAMQDGRSGSSSTSGNRVTAAHAMASEGDNDGRQSLDFNSPGYPASPQLGDNGDEDEDDGDDEAALYGRHRDASKWADTRSKASSSTVTSSGKGRARSGADGGVDDEEEDPATRLSVDLDNLPSNTGSPPGSALVGPTPLNTPTFAIARSRGGARGKQGRGSSRKTVSRPEGGSASNAAATAVQSEEEGEPREPGSPTMPRRSSATGALVAPSDAMKDAGVRVPLAHDYVEEDEGGIVGRAVEIVNTARDLIGALLGTGSDRGRSWREASG